MKSFSSDLPPERTLEKTGRGRIYAADHAARASSHFFKRGNLTALREIALRVAAERVDKDLRDYKNPSRHRRRVEIGRSIDGCNLCESLCRVLIRWTRRVADLLGVTWIGAYVESDESHRKRKNGSSRKTFILSTTRWRSDRHAR